MPSFLPSLPPSLLGSSKDPRGCFSFASDKEGEGRGRMHFFPGLDVEEEGGREGGLGGREGRRGGGREGG